MNLLKRQSQRTKLHQLDDRFHCSIIGTCLTLKELRRLYRKLKFITKSPLTDHDLHRIFVGIAGETSYANRRLQKYIDEKYQRIIKQFSKVQSVDVLETLWQEALEKGEVAGVYWALVTHPDVTDALLNKAYGDIHMLSHLSGASVRVDMQELSILRRRTKVLEKEIADAFVESQSRLKEKDKIIHTLKSRLTSVEKVESQLEKIQTQRETLEKEPVIAQLRKEIKELFTKLSVEQERGKRMEKEVEYWQSFALAYEERHLTLEQRLTQTLQERDALELSLSRVLSADCSKSCSVDQKKSCTNTDLCGRCILFVGGRTAQSKHFRHLVEQYNGRFIYHDGGRDDGSFRLGSILSQADAVLCPLDCISHDAMNKIKRYCEHNTKQLVMMPRSSLSAFVKGLNEVAV